jgi:hypothetical protein
VHENPSIGVTVTNYSDDAATKTVSLHITITVDAPSPIGNVTIFDKTMGGKYGINAVEEIMNHITQMSSMRIPK